jgi:hypothetical protein
MKATFYTIFPFRYRLFFFHLVSMMRLPFPTKLQPADLLVNKSVAEVHENAGAIVSQYTYDDVIEAYVVSTDEFGNFSRASLFKHWLQPPQQP